MLKSMIVIAFIVAAAVALPSFNDEVVPEEELVGATCNCCGKTVAKPSCSVTLYQHCNYGGYGINLAPGAYNMNTLIAKGMKNDDLSSVRIHGSCRAIMYQDINYGGHHMVKDSDDSCFTNDQMQAIPLSQLHQLVVTARPKMPEDEENDEVDEVDTNGRRLLGRRAVSWNDQISSAKVEDRQAAAHSCTAVCKAPCAQEKAEKARAKEKAAKEADAKKKAAEKASKEAADKKEKSEKEKAQKEKAAKEAAQKKEASAKEKASKEKAAKKKEKDAKEKASKAKAEKDKKEKAAKKEAAEKAAEKAAKKEKAEKKAEKNAKEVEKKKAAAEKAEKEKEKAAKKAEKAAKAAAEAASKKKKEQAEKEKAAKKKAAEDAKKEKAAKAKEQAEKKKEKAAKDKKEKADKAAEKKSKIPPADPCKKWKAQKAANKAMTKTLQKQVKFKPNKWVLRKEGKKTLDSIAGYLIKYQWMELDLEGHSTASGSYCKNLTGKRAKAAADYLKKKGCGNKFHTSGKCRTFIGLKIKATGSATPPRGC